MCWTECFVVEIFTDFLWIWFGVCDKILGGEDDRIVSDDSDLSVISDKLRLVHIRDEKEKGKAEPEFAKSDEELARMLQVFNFLFPDYY